MVRFPCRSVLGTWAFRTRAELEIKFGSLCHGQRAESWVGMVSEGEEYRQEYNILPLFLLTI